ncbi:MAG: deoxyribonuclease IV, partial [Chlamydiia bacterium]|nr:deoxyribonuclease IV [Chlamydiia bacterium]
MSQKLLIGAHTSAAGGSFHALSEGHEIGATTIQLFTSNQKQWKGREIPKEEVEKWQQTLVETGIEKPMSHAGYLINLGSPDPFLLEKSRKAFHEEIARCHLLDIPLLNIHPGAATKGTEEECLETIVTSLLQVEGLLEKGNTRVLLESTAGQGTSVGHRFEQLAHIVHQVEKKIPIGICIDTCHTFAAGYDIRTKEGWRAVLKELDHVVGLKHLFAFHLNDSEKDLGSRVDRHAPLGKGKIGLECFRFLMQDPKLAYLPKYLETPEGPPLWKEEIALLRRFH